MLSRLFIVLLSYVSISYAINCYQGVVYNSTAVPTDQLSCPIVAYCTKITAFIPVSLSTYGCDQSASLCKTSGCYDNQNGGKTCCCATDFCNLSNSNLVGLVTVIAPLLLVLLLARYI
ncbi:hypothetical protein RB195_003691 [Necator americanus]|uniref:ET module n=1 Tax=Necator americanus TaxID=51031 RepID=A0ABR1DPQ6_NECAM